MNTRYTYAAYAKEVIAIVNGEIEVTDEVRRVLPKPPRKRPPLSSPY